MTGHHEKGEDGDIQDPSRWGKLVSEFHDIFDPPGMPVQRDIVHKIELLPNAEPHYGRYYRMSAAESAEVRRQLNESLTKGWIKPSCSPWGAPIILIRKKTGELRVTVDYRALNR